MSAEQLNAFIDIVCKSDFSHCSKTYQAGVFINIAYKHYRYTFNLQTDYHYAYHSIQSLRK